MLPAATWHQREYIFSGGTKIAAHTPTLPPPLPAAAIAAATPAPAHTTKQSRGACGSEWQDQRGSQHKQKHVSLTRRYRSAHQTRFTKIYGQSTEFLSLLCQWPNTVIRSVNGIKKKIEKRRSKTYL